MTKHYFLGQDPGRVRRMHVKVEAEVMTVKIITKITKVATGGARAAVTALVDFSESTVCVIMVFVY